MAYSPLLQEGIMASLLFLTFTAKRINFRARVDEGIYNPSTSMN